MLRLGLKLLDSSTRFPSYFVRLGSVDHRIGGD